MPSRRCTLGLMGTTLAAVLAPSNVGAELIRGPRLDELVRRSAHVVSGAALEANSEWVTYGRRRRIVTYTRLRVDEALLDREDSERELLVRTLGGIVGKVGQVVSEEATLLVGEPCFTFLQRRDGILVVTGMAQGHYPLRRDAAGQLRLRSSEALGGARPQADSAHTRLDGRTLSEARALVRAVRP